MYSGARKQTIGRNSLCKRQSLEGTVFRPWASGGGSYNRHPLHTLPTFPLRSRRNCNISPSHSAQNRGPAFNVLALFPLHSVLLQIYKGEMTNKYKAEPILGCLEISARKLVPNTFIQPQGDSQEKGKKQPFSLPKYHKNGLWPNYLYCRPIKSLELGFLLALLIFKFILGLSSKRCLQHPIALFSPKS